MAAPGGLFVEQLEKVREREHFSEFTGVAGGRPVRVVVTASKLFPDGKREADFDHFLRELPSSVLEGAVPARAVERNPDGAWAVLYDEVPGTPLPEFLASRGALLPDDALAMTVALAETLAAAHARNLMHGDVAPEWVWVQVEPLRITTRLGGFGVGQLEQRLEGRQARPSDDVTGLGAVLHVMLTGHPPQPGPLKLPAGAEHLRGVLTRALGLDLSLRFRSMRELIDALSQANSTRVSPGTVLPASARRSATSLRSLGPWELVKLLGEGAMGQVFLARHSLLGRQAAIKLLRPEQYQREDLVQRFFQEARSVNQINHEHIVEISDFGHETGPDGKPTAVYFVMELLEGETLTARLNRGPLSVRSILHVVKQLVSALAAAHRLGVVHRDVKSDNLFLVTRGNDAEYVKVLDFGVAKLTQATPDAPTVSTMDGAIIGTPTSMSPEQASGQVVDRRADVYAVGVILYQLLSGRLPIDAENFGKLMALLLTKQPDPLPAQTPGGEPIPPWLAALVMRCLQKAPVDRPQSMEELTHLLEGPPTTMELPPVPAPRRPSRAVGLAVGAAVFCSVGALLALHPWSDGPPPVEVVDAGASQVVVPPPPEEPDAAVELDAGGLPADEEDAGEPEEPELSFDAGVRVLPAGPPVVFTEALFKAKFHKAGVGRTISGCVSRFQAEFPVDKQALHFELSIETSGAMTVTLLDTDIREGHLRTCVVKAMHRMRFQRLTKAQKFKLPVPLQRAP